MKPFGEYLRTLRVARGLLLREVAAQLEIDPSLLSRIETNRKRPSRPQVVRLASILKTDEQDLLVHYLSERVAYELKDEKQAFKIMRAAEKKITYMRKRKG